MGKGRPPLDAVLVQQVGHLLTVERLTHIKIAKRLGTTPGAVSGIVRRYFKKLPDKRNGKTLKPHTMISAPEPPPPPSPSMLALAEFDPVIARALRHRLALTEPKEKGAEAP